MGGLQIVFQTTISAFRTDEEYNTFAVEIIFRWELAVFIPHLIEELRIVLAYLWPNHYYHVPEEETAHAPSRVSLATGVTASGSSTFNANPSPISTPSPQEQEVPNHITQSSQQTGLSIPPRIPRPIREDLSVDKILA